MLVYSTTCPHCVTYLPIWKKLCKEKGKTAHMVSMEHSVYSDTPMAAKKPVSGVPTVLFVDPKGGIHEEDNIRDESVMKKAMTESSPMMSAESEEEEESESEEVESESESEETEEEPMLRTSEIMETEGVTEASVFRPAKNRTATPYPDSIRGTTEVEDTLPALPATPIRTLTMTGGSYTGSYGGSYTGSYTGSQRGGDPFSAFVAVARQAAPAAALLAAYGLLPKNKRSSGLGAARRSRNRKTKKAKAKAKRQA